jgi:hypothetical protein
MFSKYCIYTIRHSGQLDELYRTVRAGEFTESTNWKTGQELFEAAQADGETMPVIFAAAESIQGLIYWAKLTGVKVKESGAGATTTYTFKDLTRILPGHDLSELTLRSTRQPLSNDYIRPYAICDIPIWVRWSAAG